MPGDHRVIDDLLGSAPDLGEASSQPAHARIEQWLMAAIDHDELRELVLDAWRLVVPKGVAAAHLGE